MARQPRPASVGAFSHGKAAYASGGKDVSREMDCTYRCTCAQKIGNERALGFLRSANLIVISILTLVAVTAAASGDALQAVGNGMIELKVAGETLDFRRADSDEITLMGLVRPCEDPKLGSTVVLSTLLSNSALRKCFETTDPAINHIFITARTLVISGYVYPGHVKPDVFPKSDTGVDMSLAEWRGAGGYPEEIEVAGAADDLGFRSQQYGPSAAGMTLYELAPSRRYGNTTRPLYVDCVVGYFGVRDQTCEIILRTKDRRTVTDLHWYIFDFHGPDKSWLVYDQTARDIADAIFVARPKGDFQ